MRYLLFGVCMFSVPVLAGAHVPVLIEQTSLQDVTVIEETAVSHAYYGELAGNPHTYVIETDTPFTLYTRILVPDTPDATNNVSGLVLRDVPNERVEVVAELRAAEAGWEREFEFFGGDHYRMGPVFKGELTAGTYRIEVNTPDNIEKYVLVVGREEQWDLGYFETVRRLADVKVFFDKSQFAVVESPFVYLPLAVLVFGIVIGVWFVYRRKVQ